MDGWMDERLDGWADGWMVKWKGLQTLMDRQKNG